MELLTKVFFCALICALALVVGRTVARTVVSTGASAYSYDVSPPSSDLQSTDGLTGTLGLSMQEDQSSTATSIILSPRPTLEVTSTVVISSEMTVIPTAVSSPSVAVTQTSTSGSLSTKVPTTQVTPAIIESSATVAAPVVTVTALVTGTGSYIEYTVKKGDTLLAIAKSFGTTAKAILDLNQDIANPANLQIGQTLRIPSKK